jgi:hypothetical protein
MANSVEFFGAGLSLGYTVVYLSILVLIPFTGCF